jgi:hypothetical protein
VILLPSMSLVAMQRFGSRLVCIIGRVLQLLQWSISYRCLSTVRISREINLLPDPRFSAQRGDHAHTRLKIDPLADLPI